MARLPRIRRSFPDIKTLQADADSGDTEAQNALAGELAKGLSIKRDRQAAFHWWMRAAEGNETMQGDAIAMEQLADIFRTGEVFQQKVTPIDFDRAIEWYKKSAAAGYHDALFGLARIYQQRQDFKEALATFHRSAYVFGRRESLREYGMMIYNGNGTPADQPKGREIIKLAASMDEEFSKLGCAYLKANYGVEMEMPASDDDRKKWGNRLARWQLDILQKRAEDGDADAMVELAHKYTLGGRQAEMNREKAKNWFARAAEKGDAEAQYETGRAAKDATEAFGWFSKSAKQGYREGLREAGRCLYLGEGTKPDTKLAQKYFEQAVALKDVESMVFLGKMLEGKDPDRSKALITRALEEDKKGVGIARVRLDMLEELVAAKAKKKK
ncbi:MAG: tetratricopeptide repeat protein [Alphaproteobacteria bacterium]